MDAEILLKMKDEYEEAYVTTPLCIYASYLKSNDLCLWYDTRFVNVSDKEDYEKSELEKTLIYETTDEKQVRKIKKILGIVDYSKRLTMLYSTVTSEQHLSLTKKQA